MAELIPPTQAQIDQALAESRAIINNPRSVQFDWYRRSLIPIYDVTYPADLVVKDSILFWNWRYMPRLVPTYNAGGHFLAGFLVTASLIIFAICTAGPKESKLLIFCWHPFPVAFVAFIFASLCHVVVGIFWGKESFVTWDFAWFVGYVTIAIICASVVLWAILAQHMPVVRQWLTRSIALLKIRHKHRVVAGILGKQKSLAVAEADDVEVRSIITNLINFSGLLRGLADDEQALMHLNSWAVRLSMRNIPPKHRNSVRRDLELILERMRSVGRDKEIAAIKIMECKMAI